MTVMDDFFRFAKAYFVQLKSQVGDCLGDFLRKSRKLIESNEKVCFIRADDAKKYVVGKFHQIMELEKINSDFPPVKTPQLNGTAERLNQKLEDKIRCLIFDSGLPSTMWILAAEAGCTYTTELLMRVITLKYRYLCLPRT